MKDQKALLGKTNSNSELKDWHRSKFISNESPFLSRLSSDNITRPIKARRNTALVLRKGSLVIRLGMFLREVTRMTLVQ